MYSIGFNKVAQIIILMCFISFAVINCEKYSQFSNQFKNDVIRAKRSRLSVGVTGELAERLLKEKQREELEKRSPRKQEFQVTANQSPLLSRRAKFILLLFLFEKVLLEKKVLGIFFNEEQSQDSQKKISVNSKETLAFVHSDLDNRTFESSLSDDSLFEDIKDYKNSVIMKSSFSSSFLPKSENLVVFKQEHE
uniref:Lipoprotein n=1 Tax=Strongyloides venezuelensis TaxID=75913 RepID=A0A0K0F0K0_STRVS